MNDWIEQAAARLNAQWPRLQREECMEAAVELWAKERWRSMEPVAAVETWLRQAIPEPPAAEHAG